MGARSYICIEQENHTYLGVYCHNDGYLDYNGKILYNHYTKREKVEELIKQGDMSSLGENIEPDYSKEHNFIHRQKGVCVFYHRDRKEENTMARMVRLEDINNPNSWIEFCYIYTLDNKWIYFECGKSKDINLVDLKVGVSILEM